MATTTGKVPLLDGNGRLPDKYAPQAAIDAQNSAQASATSASGSEAAAASSAAAAQTAQAAAEAVPTTSDALMTSVAQDPDSAFAGQLSATYVAAERPEAHGAGWTFSAAADDTSAVQAAVDAAMASGRRVLLSRPYRVTQTITVSAAISIEGIGRLVPSKTQPLDVVSGLVVYEDGVTALTVTAPGVSLSNFAIVSRYAAPTSGAGIRFSGASMFQMDRLVTMGFYDNWSVADCWSWTIANSHNIDPVRYGLLQQALTQQFFDQSDNAVLNTHFTIVARATNPAAAWRYEGGAGVRWIGNKINAQGTAFTPDGVHAGAWLYGIDMQIADATYPSGEVEITNGGTSNAVTACMRIGAKGPANTGSVNKITITGHTFQGYGVYPPTTIGIDAGGSATGANQQRVVRNLTVAGCHFTTLAGGIYAHTMVGAAIGMNSWSACKNFLVSISGGTDSNGNGTQGVTMAPQAVQDSSTDPAGGTSGKITTDIDLVRDLRNNFAFDGSLSGLIDSRYAASVNLPTQNTPQVLFSIRPCSPQGTPRVAGFITLDLALAGGSGVGVGYHAVRGYASATAGAAPVVTTVGADVTVAASGSASNVTYAFDTTTAPGWILVTATNTGSGTVGGTATIEIRGRFSVLALGRSPQS